MTSLSKTELHRRMMGCWLGKAVGGTLGMPFEGHDGPLELTFYDPVPTTSLPNDDLDLQVLWAYVLDKMETPRVSRHAFAQAWLDHVDFPWDEYGKAIRNLKMGFGPPWSGSYDNWFQTSMGAAIRSEIWACLAPGNPPLAMKYAYEDACVDHAGEGIWAEAFFAALESAAFVCQDQSTLLDQALDCLPEQSNIRLAIEDTRRWWSQNNDWLAVRQQILDKWGVDNFTDVTMNLSFTILGWLAGGGDFGKSICIAVNCGKDTDCTGATLGALMGIIDPDCIDEHWLKPIGLDLVVSPEIHDIEAPKTLGGFTDLIMSLKNRLDSVPPEDFSQDEKPDLPGVAADVAFVDASWLTGDDQTPMPSFPDQNKRTILQGTSASLASDAFEGEVLLLRYRINLPEKQAVLFMFNTPSASCAWLDGKFCFSRGEGSMVPALHRAPDNQITTLELEAGEHEIVAAVAKPADGKDASWVCGIGDAQTKQWVINVFEYVYS